MPGCGNLKSHPDTHIDAIIFGRDLNGEAEDYLSEERFDKIRYYLKTGAYPNGSDRAEKSRLRSAGAHYKIVSDPDSGEEKLMLKDKEVISDPQKQYEIAHKTHSIAHAGINKTTATIADKYHWIRIKETVSQAIRNCAVCRESNKTGGLSKQAKTTGAADHQSSPQIKPQQSASAPSPYPMRQQASSGGDSQQRQSSHFSPSPGPGVGQQQQHEFPQGHLNPLMDPNHHHPLPLADMSAYESYDTMPVDPQIMDFQNHGFGVDQPHPIQQQQQQRLKYDDEMSDHDHSQLYGHESENTAGAETGVMGDRKEVSR